MANKRKENNPETQSITSKKDAFDRTKENNKEIVKPEIGAEAELPFIEKFVYFTVYLYFLTTAVYKIYLFPIGKSYKLS